ncbi:hypothetical protein A2264_01890 [candidate division WWE3 bacterium RIFOXYA2_FULL_46_9]|uniref:Uncharacterized protein n=1 Tax=candidate division WWE3 bacterium RIFOXYA2_FULL_46_9 TaxID=1802636 RepID=A0A1F4W0W5_UNCKA|nr:MAG: hypothetical protein A2264_01890 [candidate division WWE3 bacterium RIFOXYA2_FULL_46_9]
MADGPPPVGESVARGETGLASIGPQGAPCRAFFVALQGSFPGRVFLLGSRPRGPLIAFVLGNLDQGDRGQETPVVRILSQSVRGGH